MQYEISTNTLVLNVSEFGALKLTHNTCGINLGKNEVVRNLQHHCFSFTLQKTKNSLILGYKAIDILKQKTGPNEITCIYDAQHT